MNRKHSSHLFAVLLMANRYVSPIAAYQQFQFADSLSTPVDSSLHTRVRHKQQSAAMKCKGMTIRSVIN
jgi:hypothetical protein